MGWIGVQTNEGAAMIAQMIGGGHTLAITGVTVGSGYVAEANMRTATALQTEKMDGAIANKKTTPSGIELRLRVLAAAVDVGAFTMHEIGVWGHLDSGTDKLILLMQDSATGVEIPTVTQSSEFVFDLIVPVAISNTENLTVTVDTSVYATIGDIEDLEEALDGKLDADQGSENAGKFMQVGNDGVLVPAVVSFDISGKLDSTAAAPAYDPTATYAVGAKCSRNGKIYRCTTAIATAEEWNGAHWTVDDSLVTQIGAKADKDQGSGNAGKFMKVGNDGNMTPDALPDGSTSGKGVVQLLDSHASTATDKAATPKNVKEAYDLANGKAAPSNALSLTAASGSWSSATPPTQTLSATGVTASNNIIVGIGSGITAAQYEAACNAKIVCTAQGAGTITLTCYGDVPTENIPISVIILG